MAGPLALTLAPPSLTYAQALRPTEPFYKALHVALATRQLCVSFFTNHTSSLLSVLCQECANHPESYNGSGINHLKPV